MKTIFKVGDKVFDIQYGWGQVIAVDYYNRDYTVKVLFDLENKISIYTDDGKWKKGDRFPRLSFTEYTLSGFSDKKVEKYADYLGKWGKFWNDNPNVVSVGKLAGCDEEGNPYFYNTEGKNTYKNFEPYSNEIMEKFKI